MVGEVAQEYAATAPTWYQPLRLWAGAMIAGDKVRLRYLEGLENIVRGISKSAFAACGYRAGLIAGGVLANVGFHISPFVAVLLAAGVPRALAAAAVLSILWVR